jgi:hypothetical protein
LINKARGKHQLRTSTSIRHDWRKLMPRPFHPQRAGSVQPTGKGSLIGYLTFVALTEPRAYLGFPGRLLPLQIKRCKRFGRSWRCGLASMYPASDWSIAPGPHGYQRACDLISGQASNGPLGSPVFVRAGKTDPPSSSHPLADLGG